MRAERAMKPGSSMQTAPRKRKTATPTKRPDRERAPQRKPVTGPVQRLRANGTLESEGRLEGGKKTGTWTFYHADGKSPKAVGRYAHDKETGQWKWYTTNGTLRQVGNYRDGTPHGKWRRYHNGTDKLADEGTYKEGQKTGYWNHYDRFGRMRRSEDYGEVKRT